jgi:hypothetical protein
MRILALTVLASLAAMGSVQAQVRTPAENWANPYSGSPSAIAPCASPGVISTIQNRFAETEAEYWSSALKIVAIDHVQPLAFRPWGLDFIPRQFCTGVATTSDGKRRRVDYSVIEDAGIIGWGWGVQWCVAGLDRNLAYAPACKQARP